MRLLVIGAVVVLAGLWLVGTPQAEKPAAVDIEAAARSEAAAEKRYTERKAFEAALRIRLDPIIARLESDGVTRDDLRSYFEKEIVNDLDLDGMCKDNEYRVD